MSDNPTSPVTVSEGLAVLHLFCKPGPLADRDAVVAAVATAEGADISIVSIAVLGHKADIALMALGADVRGLRQFQTDVQLAGLEVVDSYVSMTEVSEYAAGLPDKMKQVRLFPNLPPKGKSAWCFYPMSKRRGDTNNWFTLDFEGRDALMREHGTSGRKFAGRIVQLITSSTGLDDYEWGVTLFGADFDDVKDVVYTLRFDEASAIYAEFGPFYTGAVNSIAQVLTEVLGPETEL